LLEGGSLTSSSKCIVAGLYGQVEMPNPVPETFY
jgi:hypothetical protein